MHKKDIVVDLALNTKQHRKAFRVEPPSSVVVVISGIEAVYKIRDISFLGVAIETKHADDFHIGQILKINVLLGQYIFLNNLSAEVVRVLPEEGLIGCAFPVLTPSEELRLTKLVLEIQKEYIRRDKSKTG